MTVQFWMIAIIYLAILALLVLLSYWSKDHFLKRIGIHWYLFSGYTKIYARTLSRARYLLWKRGYSSDLELRDTNDTASRHEIELPPHF